MNKFSKFFGGGVLFFAAILLGAGMAFAQAPQATILPSPNAAHPGVTVDCLGIIQNFEVKGGAGVPNGTMNDVLGCAIQTGKISLAMIPYFVQYVSNWMLGMIGIVSVIFIMVGGYQYIYGGLIDQKEVGKKYVENALKGLVVAILSWVIVNIVMAVVTG